MIPRLFHGTTSVHLAAIRRRGLLPNPARHSPFRGNASTIPGYTEKLVFLAPEESEAAFYARKQCEALGGYPVIFEVSLESEEALRTSDDYVHWRMMDRILEILGFEPLDEEDLDEDGDLDGSLSDKAGIVLLWREAIHLHPKLWTGRFTEAAAWLEGEGEINRDFAEKALRTGLAAGIAAMAEPWQHSLAGTRDRAVGHVGTIKTQFLRQIAADEVARLMGYAHQRGRVFPPSRRHPQPGT